MRIGVGIDDKATKPIKDIHDAFKRLQNDGAKGVAFGIGASAGIAAWHAAGDAIHEVTGFLADSVKASIDEEAGIQRLSASLRANVASWNGNTDAIETTIKRREALAFSDDALRDSLGRLVGATHDVDKAFGLQSLAMDLARFKGIDLATATQEIVKVNAGQYRSLKALGIEIDANATREQALSEIHKVTAGQAEQYGKTTAGAMEAANIAVHDLQEDVGGALAPAVRDFADLLRTELIPGLYRLHDGLANLLSPIADLLSPAGGLPAIGDAIHLLMADMDTFGEALIAIQHLDADALTRATAKMVGDAKKLGEGVHDVGKSVRDAGFEVDNGAKAVAASVGKIGASTRSAMNEGSLAASKFRTSYENAFGYVKQGADDMSEGLLSTFNALPSEIGPPAQASANMLPDAINSAISDTGQAGADQGQAYVDGIKSARSDLANAWSDFINIQKKAHTTQYEMAVIGGLLTSKNLAKGLNDARPDVRAAAEAVVTDALTELIALGGAAGLAGTRAGQMFAASFGAGAGTTGHVDTAVVSTAQILASLSYAFKATGTPVKNFGSDIGSLTKDLNGLAAGFDAATGGGSGSGKGKGAHGLAAAHKAAAEAAKKLAAAIKDDEKTAFDAATEAANKHFDTLHEKNQKAIEDSHNRRQQAIDDAHKAATAEVDAERTALNEILDAKRAAAMQPVTDAEKQLAADEAAHQRQGLVDSVTQAQDALGKNGDPTQVTSLQSQLDQANYSLTDFDRRAALDAQRATAETAAAGITDQSAVSSTDVAAREAADKAAAGAAAHPGAGLLTNAALDAQQLTADTLAKNLTDQETLRFEHEKSLEAKRYENEKKAFSDALKKTEKHLDDILAKAKDQHRAQIEIRDAMHALLAHFGVTSKSTAPAKGKAQGTDAPGSAASAVNLNVNVTVQGGVLDPNGEGAKQLGDMLAIGMSKAVKQRGMTSADFFGN